MTTALSLLDPYQKDAEFEMNKLTVQYPFNQDSISKDRWGAPPVNVDSLREACMAPLRKIRDDLVKLYFIHVHPVCPVVDEYVFASAYKAAKTEEELLRYIELPLLQAMMFTALAVRSWRRP